jgi:hypothetical protein
MSDKTQQIQAVYSSSDVAITLKIQESTLRKYCLILEKNGYYFRQLMLCKLSMYKKCM